jgi:hypothetical protein
MWNPNDFHVINEDYTVMSGTTLIIPAMNYVNGMPGEYSINVTGLFNISVQAMGTLVTYSDNNPMTKTAFLPPAFGNWEGIYFQPLSYGNISDCWFRKAQSGIQFMPGSELLYPGITDCRFEDYGDYGLVMDGVKGYTNIHDLVDFMSDTGYGVDISNGQLNFSNSGTNSCKFWGHGPGQANLRITNATVSIDEDTYFYGRYGLSFPGNCIQIRDNPTPNSTVISGSQFYEGTPGEYYIKCDGASPYIESAQFKLGGTASGALTLVANDNGTGVPSHVFLRNPINSSDPGSPFPNSTCLATGGSSITIQWFLDVYVKDPDNNFIAGVPVWVNNTLGDPAEPPSIFTDGLGYAVGFVVTELIIYSGSVDNFNAFNVSAMNNSIMGYAIPEPIINISKQGAKAVTVIVPFNPELNILPEVTWIATPVGIQTGDVSIDYIIIDPNEGQNGSLSIEVLFSTDGIMWFPADEGTGGDGKTGLSNATVHTFVWDSATKNLKDMYSDTVYIRVIPYDPSEGTPNQTFTFTVDNKLPVLSLPPMLSGITNNSVTITWSTDEACDATVWYGLNFTGTTSDLTDEETSTGGPSTSQSVTLTNLLPGRRYIFVVNSTDAVGHTASSYPDWELFVFDTQVHFQLYKGWNMISVPFNITGNNFDLANILVTIDGNWDIVWAYQAWDPWGDYWKLNDTNNPLGSDLHEILPASGVWIHMLNDDVLIPPHETPEKNEYAVPLPLYVGWNFIGYPSALTRPIDDALSGVQYDLIKTYDAATDQWLSYDGVTGDLDEMEMGRGYWIYVTEFTLWSLPYAE